LSKKVKILKYQFTSFLGLYILDVSFLTITIIRIECLLLGQKLQSFVKVQLFLVKSVIVQAPRFDCNSTYLIHQC